jgi:hypothetical protein
MIRVKLFEYTKESTVAPPWDPPLLFVAPDKTLADVRALIQARSRADGQYLFSLPGEKETVVQQLDELHVPLPPVDASGIVQLFLQRGVFARCALVSRLLRSPCCAQ